MELHTYQQHGSDHLYKNRFAALFWDPGLGKTRTVIDAFMRVRADRIPGARLLIVAPLRVALKTWPDELDEVAPRLRYAILHGPDKWRKLDKSDVDIFIINYEGLLAMYAHVGAKALPFDGIVFDELTKMKAWGTKRYKQTLGRLPQFRFRWGLTGTPAPNSLMELFGQVQMLDRGERLGKGIGKFRSRYCFQPNPLRARWLWEFNEGAVEDIQSRVADICHRLSARDEIEMPNRIDNTIELELPTSVGNAYLTMAKDLVAKLDDDTISAANAAVVTGKLQQMCNGFIYTDDSEAKHLHDVKLDTLEELIEEAQGQPVMVAYKYKMDLEMLKKRFPDAIDLRDDVNETVDAWNRGEIPILLAQPQSAGHGLNLQKGGHIIIWYSLVHSLEQYIQLNGRIERQGQSNSYVVVHHLVMRGTIDEAILDLLERREANQSALLAAIKDQNGRGRT